MFVICYIRDQRNDLKTRGGEQYDDTFKIIFLQASSKSPIVEGCLDEKSFQY